MIGWIGLGIMGAPMAENLLRKGVSLKVNDLNEQAVARLQKQGAAVGTKEEIAETCDIVFLILPNGAIVRDVLFGEQGFAQKMGAGKLVCDMSSVTPTDSRACQERLAEQGVHFVDAPVSGGEPKAKDGSLSFMAGGTEEDFQRLKPYFLKMGHSAILVGDVGSGSVAKLANQVIVNQTIAAVAEAFVLAKKAGADMQKVFEAIRGGMAGSTVLEAKGPMMLARDFRPGGKISINKKDIGNVLSTAHALDVPMPMTAQLYEIMQSLKVHGHLEEDHSALVKYFEALAGVTVGKD